MIANTQPSTEQRRCPRMVLPARYTLARVRPVDGQHYDWTGQILDISTGGMRLGLPKFLEPGTSVSVRALLPGTNHLTISVKGHIVHTLHLNGHHHGGSGLVQMGLAFDRFDYPADRRALINHLSDCGLEIDQNSGQYQRLLPQHV